jgi:hypothetical protein
MLTANGLTLFQTASILMQRSAEEGRKLDLDKRAVLAVLFAELLGLVPPNLLIKGEHGQVFARFAADLTPVRAPDDDEVT